MFSLEDGLDGVDDIWVWKEEICNKQASTAWRDGVPGNSGIPPSMLHHVLTRLLC